MLVLMDLALVLVLLTDAVVVAAVRLVHCSVNRTILVYW